MLIYLDRTKLYQADIMFTDQFNFGNIFTESIAKCESDFLNTYMDSGKKRTRMLLEDDLEINKVQIEGY